ncbi:MAG: hypothetical protein ACTS1Z_04170 [Parasphingopyxis sp.]|uniref:hypothetical protein n=1 Tax=Parasphingopyxis sp. TaxID=1920299 RepID=UPI003F9F319C
MKNLYGAALAAALCCASAANAENFTYEITWGDVNMVGGIGADGTWGRGGSVEGTYVTTLEDDSTVNGAIRCVGMDQAPSATMFAVMLACDAVRDGAADATTIAYGCNYIGDPGPDTPLGCVGGIRFAGGATGEVRRGSVTMHWHSATEAHGTGQWYE